MKLSQFKFKLPEELIASYPRAVEYNEDGKIIDKLFDKDGKRVEVKYDKHGNISSKHVPGFFAERDENRLLVLHAKSNRIEHKIFNELVEYFDDKDFFVFNDTAVFPALMHGNKEKTNAQIEVFLLRELNEKLRLWDVLVEPARKIRVGNKLYFGPDNSMVAEVIDNTTSRGRTVRFLYDGSHEDFKRDLYALGNPPIPSHFGRTPEKGDVERYQTIFAKNEGAVVIPAAGCNFTRRLMKRMEIRGIEVGYLTLHASPSMFRDIDVEDLTKHKTDSEQMDVTEALTTPFNEAANRGSKICAVGTTTLRALETASTANGEIKPFEGWTNKFIFPPYQFTTANCLISNLQLPYTTMLMNQAAFGGYEEVMNAYKVAVAEKYRFGFYGDAILILPD